MIRRTPLLPPRLRAEHGFTMIIALGVMFVTSLLLVAAFTASTATSTPPTRTSPTQQAYYAALAGVQEYEYKLEANSSYWENCEPLSSTLESGERFEVTLLPAEGQAKCNPANPFETEIESRGRRRTPSASSRSAAPGKTDLSSVPGQSRVQRVDALDRGDIQGHRLPRLRLLHPVRGPRSDSERHERDQLHQILRRKRRQTRGECTTITFTNGRQRPGADAHRRRGLVDLQQRTDLRPRKTQTARLVEINGGTYPSCSAGSEPTYNTESKTYSKGVELVAPESDESLGQYVESANKFAGVTHLVLQPKGVANTIGVTTVVGGKNVEKTISWPANGLIYVEGSGACGYEFNVESSDTSKEATEEEQCGTVYVEGTYSKSLTISGTDDVIINGNIYPTSVAGKLGTAPSGAPTLGLIATNFVRVYHPCSGGTNQSGYMPEPWIYAAILSTSHSFVVDNYKCGAKMNNLNVYGAIAQKFRGTVGQLGSHGYFKEYIYDPRLATEEPPYFLSPLKTGWKVARETAPTGG